MALWIRVEADMGDAPEVAQFAEQLYADRPGPEALAATVGHLVLLWGRVARHRVDGVIRDVPDSLLARWASWGGDPQVFAAGLRDIYCEDGVIRDWRDKQGKLVELAEKDRERKAASKRTSESRPENFRGNSEEIPVLRDETERNISSPPTSPSGDMAGIVGELTHRHPKLADVPREALDQFATYVFAAGSSVMLDNLLSIAVTAMQATGAEHRNSEQVGAAMRDYVANRKEPNPNLWRGYLRNASAPPEPRERTTRSGRRGRREDRVAAAGAADAHKLGVAGDDGW